MRLTPKQQRAVVEWQGMSPQQQRFVIYQLYGGYPMTKALLMSFLPARGPSDKIVHEVVALCNPQRVTTCGAKAPENTTGEPQEVTCFRCFKRLLQRP